MNLKKKEIKEICILKNKEWKFGLQSQLQWFNNYIKRFDIHNLLYNKKKLIGYTLLRLRSYRTSHTNKLKKYLLLDTLLVDKKYRKLNYSNFLMNFNNEVILKKNLSSFLICNKTMVNFYKKNKWIKLSRKKINLVDHKLLTNGMIYNFKNYKKYFFCINR